MLRYNSFRDVPYIELNLKFAFYSVLALFMTCRDIPAPKNNHLRRMT
jgi:hypothetical protein